MRYRSLGDTGMHVSSYCLGAMMFGGGANTDHDDCVRIIHHALDAGINFIDTADVYGRGESEEIVGKALRGRREEVILATKAFAPMGDGPNERGNSRRWILHEIDASLKRLQTDWIDLYQIHRPDPSTDIEETLSTLSDAVHAGKVRTIGTSTFPVEQIVEAQWVAERRGYVRFRCEQPQYSLFMRGAETAVLPTCERYGMGVILWGPLHGGWLTGKYRSAADVDLNAGRAKRQPNRFDPSIPANGRKFELLDEFEKIAKNVGVSLNHLAMAFSVTHPTVTSAIIGPRTHEQLIDTLAGADLELDDETLDRIDAVMPPGENVREEYIGYTPPALVDAALRRRPKGSRSAV